MSDEYERQGLARNFHGPIHQVKLTMFFFLRALKLKYNFEIRTEFKKAKNLDDIVIFYGEQKVMNKAIFIQVKHKQDEDFKMEENDFIDLVETYFFKFPDILNESDFKNKEISVVIATNAKVEKMQDFKECTLKSYIDSKCYSVINNSDLYKKLEDRLSEASTMNHLSTRLARNINERKKIISKNSPFDTFYKYLCEKIFIGSGFNPDFVNGAVESDFKVMLDNELSQLGKNLGKNKPKLAKQFFNDYKKKQINDQVEIPNVENKNVLATELAKSIFEKKEINLNNSTFKTYYGYLCGKILISSGFNPDFESGMVEKDFKEMLENKLSCLSINLKPNLEQNFYKKYDERTVEDQVQIPNEKNKNVLATQLAKSIFEKKVIDPNNSTFQTFHRYLCEKIFIRSGFNPDFKNGTVESDFKEMLDDKLLYKTDQPILANNFFEEYHKDSAKQEDLKPTKDVDPGILSKFLGQLKIYFTPSDEELKEMIKEELSNEFTDTEKDFVYCHFMEYIISWFMKKTHNPLTDLLREEYFEVVTKDIKNVKEEPVEKPVEKPVEEPNVENITALLRDFNVADAGSDKSTDT